MDKDQQRLIGWFLWYLDCSITSLAGRAGVDESSVRRWANGKQKLRRAQLEKLAEAARLSMTFIDAVVLPQIAAVRLGRATEEEVFRELSEAARALEGSLAGVGRTAVVELVTFLEAESSEERESAKEQCERLKTREAEDLWYLVEARPEFQTRELALLLACESEEAASDDAGRALLLARVAQRVAQLAGGGAIEGVTLAFMVNAYRVGNQMEEAETTFERAVDRWQAGEETERATLPGWRLLDLEGSLRRDQRRFPEALERLADAEAAAPPESIPRILVKRAVTLEHMGNAEGAIAVLQAAAVRADGQQEPRLLLKIYFNLGANLCHLDRYGDAEELLPRIAELAAGSRKELDEIRIGWLRARIAGGLGRVAEARVGFDRVRGEFERRGMGYDYALASLERAELDLREGRTAEVKSLAEEMRWIFSSKKIHREALAALALFRRAAEREQATAELAGRLVRYLYRAQHDPELKFEG
ncbi:MAG TPA: helix-turn-helix transcriptional regulator [Thermoanaerobaculia bacterium]|nr:helix-turn-helix transcriptional regulator [Thermoanaerobaculia bacterium]